MYVDLEAALDKACPKISYVPKVGESLWYSDSLKLLHLRVRKQFRKAMNTGVQAEFCMGNLDVDVGERKIGLGGNLCLALLTNIKWPCCLELLDIGRNLI